MQPSPTLAARKAGIGDVDRLARVGPDQTAVPGGRADGRGERGGRGREGGGRHGYR